MNSPGKDKVSKGRFVDHVYFFFLTAWFHLVTLNCPNYRKVVVLAFLNQERGCLGRLDSSCWLSHIPAQTVLCTYLCLQMGKQRKFLRIGNHKDFFCYEKLRLLAHGKTHGNTSCLLFSQINCPLSFSCHSAIYHPDTKTLSTFPRQSKVSRAAWISVTQDSTYSQLLWAAVSVAK